MNEHGDLYFLLHKFGVQIYPFKLDKLKKNSAKGKKLWLKKGEQSSLLDDAKYYLERNDSRNVLSRCCMKLHGFFTNYVSYCSICSRPSTYQVFFLSVTLKNLASNYLKMYRGPIK